MVPRYKDWTVRGYARPEHDAEGFRTEGTEVVVSIAGGDGPAYQLVIAEPDSANPVVRSLMLTDYSPEGITPAMAKDIPTGWLRDVALGFVAEMNAQHVSDPLTTVSDAALQAERGPGAVGVRNSPTLAEFAREWDSMPSRTPTPDGWLSRRHVLAERHGVAPATVDRWARKARDAGLLKSRKVRSGRPRAPRDEPTTTTTEGIDQ